MTSQKSMKFLEIRNQLYAATYWQQSRDLLGCMRSLRGTASATSHIFCFSAGPVASSAETVSCSNKRVNAELTSK